MDIFEGIMKKLEHLQNFIETESERAQNDYCHLIKSMMDPTEQNKKQCIKTLNQSKQKYLSQFQTSQKVTFKKKHKKKKKYKNRLQSNKRITAIRQQSFESNASCSDSSSSSSSSIEILTEHKTRNVSNYSNCSTQSNIEQKWKSVQESLNCQQTKKKMTFNIGINAKKQSVIRTNQSNEEKESEFESESDSDCFVDGELKKQIESIEISDCESDVLSEIDSNVITPRWCDTKEKIMALSKQNRKINPSVHFGDRKNVIINIKKVFGADIKIKKTSNWAKADLLSKEENLKYLKFMGWA